MKPRLRKALVLWFNLFTILLTLQCCGRVTQSADGGLEVKIETPAEQSEELFWYGVTKRQLRVEPKEGDPQVFDWQPGAEAAVPLKEGDQLVFLGSDENGRLLVTGETKVGAEKKATIALRRVL